MPLIDLCLILLPSVISTSNVFYTQLAHPKQSHPCGPDSQTQGESLQSNFYTDLSKKQCSAHDNRVTVTSSLSKMMALDVIQDIVLFIFCMPSKHNTCVQI